MDKISDLPDCKGVAFTTDYWTADHGRSDWLGYWVEFVQKARFKKLACLCHIKQNDLTYLGRVCTPCLSVSTGIYDWTFTAADPYLGMTMHYVDKHFNMKKMFVSCRRRLPPYCSKYWLSNRQVNFRYFS